MEYILEGTKKRIERSLEEIEKEIKKAYGSLEPINRNGISGRVIDDNLDVLLSERQRLKDILANAIVFPENEVGCQESIVQCGSIVEIIVPPAWVERGISVIKVEIVPCLARSMLGEVDMNAPLGAALFERKVGDVVQVEVSGYDSYHVTIVGIARKADEAVKSPSESSPVPYVKKKSMVEGKNGFKK